MPAVFELAKVMEKTSNSIVVFSKTDWQHLRKRFVCFGKAVAFSVGSKKLYYLNTVFHLDKRTEKKCSGPQQKSQTNHVAP